MSDEETRLVSGLAGRLRGFLPDRLPDWFAPRSINFVPERFGPFERSQRVTPDGNVVIVPTPGHTPGHVSVIVVDGGVCHFLAGDTTYTQKALVGGQVDGVSPSEAVSLRTMRSILRLAQEHPTVYLPSHDPESGDRLARGATVRLNEHVRV